jgi:hypothetical protein
MVVFGSTGAIRALGDFDGDDFPDLIGATDFRGPTSVLYGNGDGTFAQGPIIPDMGWQAIAADLDGDGHLDLLSISDGEAAFSVHRGAGSRTVPFGAPTVYPSPNGLFSILLADFDQDGRVDLAAADSQGLEFWRGQVGGVFEGPRVLSAGLSEAGAWHNGRVLATDWNGDGNLDLVYGSDGFQYSGSSVVLGAMSRLSYRLGHGDGTFDDEVACALTMGIIGDFDHDNRPDLISSSKVKGATLSLGINGCSQGKALSITDWTKQGGVALADFNGDGNLDVVIDDNQAIMVHVGDGHGGFPHALTYPAPSSGDWPLGGFLVGDLNRDGKLDIVFAREGGWGVLLNTCQ